MKYKPLDKVRIKSLDWYNRYTNGTEVNCKHYSFICDMKKYCGQIMTINVVRGHSYDMIEDGGTHAWTDEMIEGLVEEESNACQKCVFAVYDDKPHCGLRGFRSDFNVERCSAENDTIPNGYELQEDGYFSWVEKKKEYPKTYEECCKVMGVNHTNDLDICEHCDYKTEITYYEDNLLEKIEALYRLRICRDAYWKIYGEENGLGKPWEPDWTSFLGYPAIYMYRYLITLSVAKDVHHCLAFPTEEMRDAFYENFKKEIEFVKELL